MIEKLNFKFVLLGQLQSDPIESRFGWLRQLFSANYIISIKQVLDSERKIRALSLLKFSRFSLSDIDAKNLVKDLTNKADNDIRQSSKKRKIAKLTSSKKHL